ncbi:Uncharacterized protein GBIM_00039 [Gryllus bimaculatus]|nr:Uncharacterized protein GBIM_00039 [Gryllus bimaculatus]
MQAFINETSRISFSVVTLVFSSAAISHRMSQSQSTQWFYAVGKGRQVGVYTTWPECQKQVENISNAKYRKFKTHKEAVAFIQECKEKYSPSKSPSKFIRDSALPSTVPAIPNTCSQRSSSVQPTQLPINMSNSQPVASKSMALSQRVSRTNIVNASRTLAGRSEVQNELTPLTVSALQSLAEEDPFLTEDTQRNAKNTSSINGTEVSEIKAVLERVVTQYSEIKSTLEQMLLKLNNLENKVEELSCQISTGNQNVGMPSVSRSSIKRSLFESFNVPQPIGSRSLCTTPPEDEIEVVPVPPKKIPKIELNSDDEADGFDHDFRVNEDGYVIVYTDGACEKNGRCGAKAGIGVWFGDSHPLNISEPVHGRATNNTAEIQAAVQALEVAKRAGVKRILVHTDSEFTINCITKWVKKWVKNNWKVASGADVKNKEDLILLLEAMKNIEVKWEHVRGHRGIHGNEMADRLARSGAERYKP